MAKKLYGWDADLTLAPIPRLNIDTTDAGRQGRISIVIPTLNQGETIEDTLLSIICQDYKNYEIIVIDGGSTDNTGEILDRYRGWITKAVSEPDKGQANAINKGFKFATGDIYAWINSDDFYLPGAFTKVAGYFQSDPTVRFVVGAGDIVSKDQKFLKYIPAHRLDARALLNWSNDSWVMQQSCFWIASLWKDAGGVDESLSLLFDLDLWFKFSKLCPTFVVQDKLAVMRFYPEIKTVRQRHKTSAELAYVRNKNKALDTNSSLARRILKKFGIIRA